MFVGISSGPLGGLPKAVLRPLGDCFGVSWDLFWASWWPLGASWGPPGGLLGPLGRLLVPLLGASWGGRLGFS
eukprot:1468041-Pyramimonas_sp.AAC.1